MPASHANPICKLHHQDFPSLRSGADKVKPVAADGNFFIEASIDKAAGSRIDADFGFDTFGANHVVLGIDPALGLAGIRFVVRT